MTLINKTIGDIFSMKGKSIFYMVVSLSMLCCSCKTGQHEVTTAPYAAFDDNLLPAIHAEGWIAEFLERQRTGLSGHPEALSYPYDTALWDGEIRRQSTHGEGWWRYEQTAYYTDGILKLGYLLNDSTMIARGENGVNYTIAHATPEGKIGSKDVWDGPRWRMWPQAVFFRSMKSMYEMTGDVRIPETLEKYYLSCTAEEVGTGRNACNIEGILWTYGKTGNSDLLRLAEDAFENGDFELKPSVLEKGDPIVIHGVTFCEMHKLPAILYAYTGKQRYLDLARMAENNLIDNNMLPDGTPTSAEWVKGHDVMAAHETCDIADFTWGQGYHLMADGQARHADNIERAVFNAAPGAVTKDFKALQYFSCVNQFNVTGDSDHNEYRRGLTWMAYRPTHETECCAGNVHRIMPNYVQRMWMTDRKGGLVAALHGPSRVDFVGMTVRQSSQYPFEDCLRFEFSGHSARFPFTFRIPSWSRGCKVSLNGRAVAKDARAGEFTTLIRRWKDGDVLEIRVAPEIKVLESADSAGAYVTRGALLYTLPITETWTEDTRVHPGLNGKHSANPDFKSWNITPSGNFNYAICSNDAELISFDLEGGSEVSSITGDDVSSPTIHNAEALVSGSYPFDNPPFGIIVPVKRIKWDLEEGRYTPNIPVSPEIIDDTIRMVTLIPYGCTELRLTVFPTL